MSLCEVYGIVGFLACGVDAGEEHHFVGLFALGDCRVYALDILDIAHALIVDIKDYEAILHACILELAVLEAGDL